MAEKHHVNLNQKIIQSWNIKWKFTGIPNRTSINFIFEAVKIQHIPILSFCAVAVAVVVNTFGIKT